jgi:Protein of unknown function (DUF1036)
MLKNITLPLFTSLIAPISAIALQSSASASTVFCNKTDSPVRVAYARGTLDPTLSIEMTSYKVKGWLKIAPGACMTASTEPADKIDRPNGYDLVRHYYYAKSTNKKIALTAEFFQRTEKFWIKDSNFKYDRGLGYESPKLKCSRGYKQIDFSTFYSTTPEYTVLLTSPQSSLQK